MNNRDESRIKASERLKIVSIGRNATVVLSFIAIAVVVSLLHQIGIAITADRTPLSCVFSATDAHTHDESCYRNGILVCPVPEREEHHHTDECYREEQVLSCGKHEGENGHVHDESCYQTQKTPVCGLEETTGVHVHSPACFYATKPEMTKAEKEFEETIVDDSLAPIISVHAIVPAGAIPADATMHVTLLDPETVSDAVTEELTKDDLQEDRETVIADIRAVDISFVTPTGEKVEPLEPITVTMTSPSIAEGTTEATVVHIDDEDKTETIAPLDREALAQHEMANGDDQLSFESDEFSKYVLATFSRSQHLVASDGMSYEITLECPATAGIPSDTVLSVMEITEGTPEYAAYKVASEQAVGQQLSLARFFDISLTDADGREIQPADGTSVSVQVSIDGISSDASGDSATQVIHFGQEMEFIQTQMDDGAVCFDASGFSVYAIVDVSIRDEELPPPSEVVSLEEMLPHGEDGFYMSVTRTSVPEYFRNTMNGNSCFNITSDVSGASTWFFEPVDGASNQYRIYTIVAGNKRYVTNPSGNLAGLGDAGVAFELSLATGNSFKIKKVGENKWLQYSGSGGGIRFWTDAKNAANSNVTLTYASSFIINDPYDLDGKTYGIAYASDANHLTAMMAEAKSSPSPSQSLVSNALRVRPDIVGRDGSVLYVNAGADVSMWTFHNIEGNTYALTTVLDDGTVAYLCIGNDGVSLTTDPEAEGTSIEVVAGVDARKGKICLSYGDRSICLTGGNPSKGFGTTTNQSNAWMSLVEKSEVEDDDFTDYRARRISFADTDALKDGDQIVLYARVWNETALCYEVYVIDYDGTLIKAYPSGDILQWVGNAAPTSLWDFTEYHYEDGTPNYYYELQNAYSGKYIAPQIGSGQVLSDEAIGVNLNGRRYGDDYTTIIAWDDPYYEYAGLKVQDGHLVSCPLNQADDIYAAVIVPKPGEAEDDDEDEELTTIRTVDNDEYGITMRMIDFNNRVVKNRDTVQNAFFGGTDNNVNGLLSTNLGEDGYPVTMQATTGHEDSLAELFVPSQMQDVNHLFTQSAYEESGYFEYDCTQNFASLQDDGNFKVYDQIGSNNFAEKNSLKHGQFMPFNDLTPGRYMPWTNQTDILGNTLSDLDPRKNENLYMVDVAEADYFFGMEMEASFSQTVSGLDHWGHDIIFEFTGDDDFWLYVDGELVLDIGGIHSSSAGSINFRTGEINLFLRDASQTAIPESRRPTVHSLYEAFHNNYIARGMTEEQAQAKLAEIFVQNADGQYVFKNYTSHTMKVWYMERGASASNLQMRFNLTAAKPGTVTLTKEISGTEKTDYTLAEFPYQVFYRLEGEDDYRLLSESTEGSHNVTYTGTNTPAKYKDSFTPSGSTHSYQSVFFLKPDQSIDIAFPDGTSDYYIRECGVSPSIYDAVTANDALLAGTDPDGDGRHDYETPPASIADRPRVEYVNHVSNESLRTLSITKRLFAEDGVTPIAYEQDKTTFSYRLYLSGESSDTLEYANMHEYHVKNPDGEYCRWDVATQTFASLGKSSYADLTDSERQAATFITSSNGSISKIPVDHTVEVRELIVNAKFKVIERDSEIPAGYKLLRYQRVNGSYIETTDDGSASQPNSGTIRDNDDPAIEVHNQRGWGLTVEKQWSDESFVSSHEPIYMAVYVDDGNGDLVMLPGTVHQIAKGTTSTRWFFDSLVSGKSFGDYVIREVSISETDPDVASDGTVTNPGAVTPIDEHGTLHARATLKGATESEEYIYKASYQTGSLTGAATDVQNVRSDIVTNSRPGIRIVKTDWAGNALAGARFSIRDSDGHAVGNASYTSGADGLVTIAYLNDGEYALTETKAPTGYRGLADALAIVVSHDAGDVEVSATNDEIDGSSYEFVETGEMPTLFVRNHPSSIQLLKVDKDGNPLAGATFKIYRQMLGTNGKLRPEDDPVDGYDSMVSGDDGIASTSLQALAQGTYYLVEAEAPEGYRLPSGDLTFSIQRNGMLSIDDSSSWSLNTVTAPDGTVTCVLSVVNKKQRKVSFEKVDIANPQHIHLQGAKFDLYEVIDDVRANEPTMQGMTSDNQGVLVYDGQTVFEMLPGTYEFVETAAPAGYHLLLDAVRVTVSDNGITYDDGTAFSRSGQGISYDDDTDVYTLRISNTRGLLLPSTGSFGYILPYIIGGLMVGASARYLRRDLQSG